MATEQDVQAAKDVLWLKAEKLFKESHPNVRTKALKNTFTIKRAIRDIKQSSHMDGKIPGILEKMQLFIDIGNKAMVAAPETVSLAWMGFSFIGQVIVKDANLRLFIKSAAEEMFEAVGFCEIYAQRYLRGRVQNYSMDTKSKVRSRIPQLLCAVLNFSHLVRKYTEKKGVVRVLAGNFTTMETKMQEAAAEAKSKLTWLEKAATRDFEDSALDHLRWMSCKLDMIDHKITTQDIQRTFNERIQALNERIAGLEAPEDRRMSHLKERWQDTCSWIFEEENFKLWSEGRSGLLWLHGASGFGKSFIMSTVIDDQPLKSGPDALLLSFFCKRGKDKSETGFDIMMHLCAQLLSKAKFRTDDNLRLQQECNSIIGDRQASLARLSKSISHMEVPQIGSLFDDLARQFQEQIIIAVDGLDECVDLEASNLVPTLKSLVTSKHLCVRVVISSCPTDSPSLHHVRSLLEGVSCIEVNREKTENDISKYVEGSIKKEFAHWGEKKIEMAKKEILSSSGGQFKYASDVIKRLKEPSARDLTFEELAPTFPKTSGGFYRQKFAAMENGDRKFLVIALRWLICGRETMDLFPIADELYHRYDNDTGSLLDSSIREQAAKRLEKIGCGFLKVTSTSIQLDHGPIRDFVNSEDNAQDELSKLILQAGSQEGGLLLADTILRRLNSHAFQKAHLTSDAQSVEPLRYELGNWMRHLTDSEDTWDVEACDEEHRKRLEALLDAADSFMKADNGAYYRSWLRQTSSSEESRKDTRLHTACRYGLSGLMKRFLNRGHSVNHSNGHKNTPLHLVCMSRGHFRGLDLLLDKNRKANLNLQNKDGATPLLLAVKNVPADLNPVKSLLTRGADPRIPDKSGSTCLHFATAAHNKVLCEILLHHETLKVNVDAEDKVGETPLHWACKERNAPKDLIELLLNNKANLNAQDADSQAPLYEACRVGNVIVAKFLLEKGADINDDDVRGETALHATVYDENKEIADLLIRYNAPKVKSKDEKVLKAGNQTRTLPEAEKNESSDGFRPLDLFKRNSKGQDALTFAAASNKGLMVSYLLAVYRDRQLGMKTLLNRDKAGFIPLHYCIQRNNRPVARKLLEEGDGRRMCTVATNKGNQALHLAAAKGYSALAKLLLQYSAPTSTGLCETPYGPTPLDAAFSAWHGSKNPDPKSQSQFEDTIETIFNARAIKDVVPGHRRKLHLAIFRGSKRVCKLFQNTWSQKDQHDWTARMLAAAYKFDLSQIRDQGRLPGAPPVPPPTPWNQPRPATKSPLMWENTTRRANVKRSDDGLKVTFTPHGDSTSIQRAVRTDHPVPYNANEFYFEIKVEEGEVRKSSIAVGFCSELAYCNQMPGSKAARALTWSYHGEKGEKYARSVSGQSYSEPFGKGDVIGCRLDLTHGFGKGTISFTKNEIELGPAFEKTVKGQLFPVVGFSGSVETRVSLRFPDL